MKQTPDDDDRFDRWCDTNGINSIAWVTTDDGRMMLRYYRSDGTEVTPGNSFPYDAKLTPYTKPSGTA